MNLSKNSPPARRHRGGGRPANAVRLLRETLGRSPSARRGDFLLVSRQALRPAFARGSSLAADGRSADGPAGNAPMGKGRKPLPSGGTAPLPPRRSGRHGTPLRERMRRSSHGVRAPGTDLFSRRGARRRLSSPAGPRFGRQVFLKSISELGRQIFECILLNIHAVFGLFLKALWIRIFTSKKHVDRSASLGLPRAVIFVRKGQQ